MLLTLQINRSTFEAIYYIFQVLGVLIYCLNRSILVTDAIQQVICFCFQGDGVSSIEKKPALLPGSSLFLSVATCSVSFCFLACVTAAHTFSRWGACRGLGVQACLSPLPCLTQQVEIGSSCPAFRRFLMSVNGGDVGYLVWSFDSPVCLPST